MDPGGGIGRAGAAGNERHAGPPGHLAIGVGHIGHSALLPTDGQVDLGHIMERVEHRQEAFARHGEYAVAALNAKLVDENLATGA